MRTLFFFLLPVLSFACVAEGDLESVDNSQDATHPERPRPDAADIQPHDPCATVLCMGGYECSVNCDDDPVCNPVVCEGFAGWQCEKGFTCAHRAVANGADQGGECVKDCNGGSCGECISNEQCGSNEQCSTVNGDCESWCECPQCDVCAGKCVPIAQDKCGECTSNNDCGISQICSVQNGDCEISCDCPLCAVCAGSCVDK